MTVIHLQGVSKHYGRVPALCDVNLRFEHGLSVVVGPSGSGKTTLSEIIAGWRPCDDGRVLFPEANGSGPPRIGLAPQELAVYPTLTVGENLQIFAELNRHPGLDPERQIAATAVLLGLRDLLGRPVGSLSTGQQRCVQTALALVANPPVLLLDEPTAGVDADERRHLLGVVRTLADEGRTVIHTTQDLSEVELLAPGQVVVLDHGVVRFAGPLAELPGRDLRSTYLQLVDRGRENVLAP